jgi:hypothetical protein
VPSGEVPTGNGESGGGLSTSRPRPPRLFWPPLRPADRASSDVHSCAVPFWCAARPPLLAISRCFSGDMDANPRRSLRSVPLRPLAASFIVRLSLCVARPSVRRTTYGGRPGSAGGSWTGAGFGSSVGVSGAFSGGSSSQSFERSGRSGRGFGLSLSAVIGTRHLSRHSATAGLSIKRYATDSRERTVELVRNSAGFSDNWQHASNERGVLEGNATRNHYTWACAFVQ